MSKHFDDFCAPLPEHTRVSIRDSTTSYGIRCAEVYAESERERENGRRKDRVSSGMLVLHDTCMQLHAISNDELS